MKKEKPLEEAYLHSKREYKDYLLQEYKKDSNWSKENMIDFAKMLQVKYRKVYKWKWDQDLKSKTVEPYFGSDNPSSFQKEDSINESE